MPPATSLEQVATHLRTPLEYLEALNPHLIRGRTPDGETYPVDLPHDAPEDRIASLGRPGQEVRRAD